jgi:hypothetical protein
MTDPQRKTMKEPVYPASQLSGPGSKYAQPIHFTANQTAQCFNTFLEANSLGSIRLKNGASPEKPGKEGSPGNRNQA